MSPFFSMTSEWHLLVLSWNLARAGCSWWVQSAVFPWQVEVNSAGGPANSGGLCLLRQRSFPGPHSCLSASLLSTSPSSFTALVFFFFSPNLAALTHTSASSELFLARLRRVFSWPRLWHFITRLLPCSEHFFPSLGCSLITVRPTHTAGDFFSANLLAYLLYISQTHCAVHPSLIHGQDSNSLYFKLSGSFCGWECSSGDTFLSLLFVCSLMAKNHGGKDRRSFLWGSCASQTSPPSSFMLSLYWKHM